MYAGPKELYADLKFIESFMRNFSFTENYCTVHTFCKLSASVSIPIPYLILRSKKTEIQT